PERLCNDRWNDGGVAERRQRSPEDAAGKLVSQLCGELQREARLSRPARPGKRQQPIRRISSHGECGLELMPPAEERGRRNRQIRSMQCLERWKGRFAELVETERGRQILEPVLAEIAEWKRSGLQQGRGRRREQDLASVSRRRDPRRPVDVEADVVVVRNERLARVQAHANTDRCRRKARLRLSSTGDGVARRREDAEERISLRVDLDTAVGGK